MSEGSGENKIPNVDLVNAQVEDIIPYSSPEEFDALVAEKAEQGYTVEGLGGLIQGGLAFIRKIVVKGDDSNKPTT